MTRKRKDLRESLEETAEEIHKQNERILNLLINTEGEEDKTFLAYSKEELIDLISEITLLNSLYTLFVEDTLSFLKENEAA